MGMLNIEGYWIQLSQGYQTGDFEIEHKSLQIRSNSYINKI